jgi:hypothetical protein
MQRNDLEEFFMECVEEVRKDIVRRKQSGIGTKRSSIMIKKSTSSKTIGDPKDEE